MPADDEVYREVEGLPAPWDTLTVRQALYLRHRVALVPCIVIAAHYGIAEASVRQALVRAARQFGMAVHEMVALAAREGVAPLPLPY